MLYRLLEHGVPDELGEYMMQSNLSRCLSTSHALSSTRCGPSHRIRSRDDFVDVPAIQKSFGDMGVVLL